MPLVPAFPQFFHHRLDQRLRSFHTANHGLQVEGGLAGIAAGGAVDPMLPHHDQRIGDQIERDRQPTG